MPRLTVDLDDGLHMKLRLLSVTRRESLQQMMVRLIKQYVAQEARSPSRARKEAKRKR